MKYCRESKQIVPDHAEVCPYHKSARCLSTFGNSSSKSATSPGPTPSHATVAPAAHGADDLTFQLELRGLERRVRRGRRRSLFLTLGTVLVVAAGAALGVWHHFTRVLSYAELDPRIEIVRDATDPARLAISYRPLSPGQVSFLRVDDDRKAEVVDRVTPGKDTDKLTLEWRWREVQTGKVVRVTYREGWSLKTQEVAVPEPRPAPPPPPLGDALLTGNVVDATKNTPLTGAQVLIVGTRLKQTTGSDGGFRLGGAPVGPVGIEVSAPGFNTEQFEMLLKGGSETSLRVVLNRGMEAGQIRFILTWNALPKDLDAHLQGPLPGGKRFEVSYGWKGEQLTEQYAKLDVDCRTGFGPETITASGSLPGTYHYYVEVTGSADYATNNALATSGAEVRVIQGKQKLKSFRPDGISKGNIWHVCDVEVTKKGATIRKIDQYEARKYHYVRGNIVLVVDTSDSMAGENLQAAKNRILEFIGKGNNKVGLVALGQRKIIYNLAFDREPIKEAVMKLAAGGGAPLDEQLERAYEMLKDDAGDRSIMVYTACRPDDSQKALDCAQKIKQSGIEIWGCGFGKRDSDKVAFFLKLVTSLETAAWEKQ